MTRVTRRRALQGLAGGAALLAMPRLPLAAASATLPGYPFRLGVASGFPTDRSLIIWTRLAPDPGAPAGAMPAQDWPLRYEVAEDMGFRRIIARGEAVAAASLAHSVRVPLLGLRPAREYWYRFMAGEHVSASGRTRTLPAPRDRVRELRIAVLSCQHYETGYYTALRLAGHSVPDLTVHVGDYIYEGGPGGANRLRLHTGQRCVTLDDYRARYALYQSDPDLQLAHATSPWFVTWDDHEVANDYSGATPGRAEDPQLFLARRAAAYQAWYEHMPAPPSMAPRDGRMRIHARAALGRLATLHVLDQRQYRSPQSCPRPPQLAGMRVGDECTERLDPSRTMLGTEQERWLAEGLESQRARWTVLAQGTPFTHMNQGTTDAPQYFTDGWTGYPAARQRVLDALEAARSTNPVILSGDIHAFGVCGVNAVPERPDSPLRAAEFCTSSVSSDPIGQATLDRWRAANPNVHRLDGSHRGYLAVTLSEQRMQAELVAVEDARRPDSSRVVAGSYVVEAGDPRILPA
jgi:alkaline phosphatase D